MEIAMETAIERLTVLGFLILGLSQILQPRVWVQFLVNLREQGESGIFMFACLHLPLGLLIVSFHNVWTGIPAVVTVLGWVYVLKSTLYLLCPAMGIKWMGRIGPERVRKFRIAGVVFVGLGLLLAYPLIAP